MLLQGVWDTHVHCDLLLMRVWALTRVEMGIGDSSNICFSRVISFQAASDRDVQSLKSEVAKRGHLVGTLEADNTVLHSTRQTLFDILWNDQVAPVVRHAPSNRTPATAKLT